MSEITLVETNTPQNIARTLWRDFFDNVRRMTAERQIEREETYTVNNQRENHHWGDELKEKHDGILRVYCINANGINIDRRGGKFNNICEAMKEIRGDIICIQEHNLDTTQARVRKTLYDTANQHWQRLQMGVGTTPMQYHTAYKPGGTMMLAMGDVTGRIIAQQQDKWGRWAIQELRGRAERKIAICTAYQVVEKHGESGLLSVERQQQALLLQDQDTVTDPRTAFRRDLNKELFSYQSRGYELLVVGDFNEEFGSDMEGMERLANELGLVNLIPTLHPRELPATYARGTKCLDYAMATPLVRDALRHAGYEPFNQRINSDHRGFFLDFDQEALFGIISPNLSRREPRMLQSWNVRQVTEYIRKKHAILEQHNAFERSDWLTFLGNRHEFAERLDRDMLAASLSAEQQTHRYREPEWSVALVEARKVVLILTKCLSAIRTGLDMRDILEFDMRMMNEPFQLPLTKSTCSTALKAAKKRVTEIVSESYQRRDEERDRKIHQLATSDNVLDKNTVKTLRRQKQKEENRNLSRKLKQVRTVKKSQGVTRLEIPVNPQQDPKSCTEWKQIDIPEEVLKHLVARNQKHFGQAQGTPFTVYPLAEALSFDGLTPTGEDILQGAFDTMGMDENVAALIRHMRQVDAIEALQSRPTINDADFVKKLQIWTESTTTSPSGLHLGHYKALIGRHTHSIEAADDQLPPEFVAIRNELDQKQAELREFHLRLINYSLERGYSYQRWQKVANTVLFKDDNNVKIHRTRIIHLYEADYNLILGIKWRAAMHQEEDLKLLNEGQYGSRPHRNSKDPVLLEELQYEIIASRERRWRSQVTMPWRVTTESFHR